MMKRRTRWFPLRIARRFVTIALVLLVLILLILWLTPIPGSADNNLPTRWWALSHRPILFALMTSFVVALPFSIVAWCRCGIHRLWLIIGWVLFISIAAGRFGNEIGALIQMVWWYAFR